MAPWGRARSQRLPLGVASFAGRAGLAGLARQFSTVQCPFVFLTFLGARRAGLGERPRARRNPKGGPGRPYMPTPLASQRLPRLEQRSQTSSAVSSSTPKNSDRKSRGASGTPGQPKRSRAPFGTMLGPPGSMSTPFGSILDPCGLLLDPRWFPGALPERPSSQNAVGPLLQP